MISHSIEETESHGEALARLLRPGDTVWLYGDLGAGKTALVRGLARGLGVTDRVTSPTYAIVNVYTGRVPLAHYDAYRLDGFDDLLGAGWDEYENGVRVVEWAERAGETGGVCIIVTALNDTEREFSLCFLP
ncbi:MAG: tRNA (adenosine(37)-N6)-threonylcarbamoyltransferase complex ATPase subunit type 1 TsaE [Oscillospiraceae bacterium]|jgi:tRNA threonylcarbamoyladenosine biosynthesis protein TsaE|nr:tRNA (adenosine(37)-N6)-threonylcarbamoyltransferase complex ATPase subunit type 1 TsaE [Oscillospiraceae bacterium]